LDLRVKVLGFNFKVLGLVLELGLALSGLNFRV
jgi:hypothetical protein